MRQTVLKPNAPALSGETIYKLGTTQKKAHNKCQQLGISGTVDKAALRTGHIIPGLDTFVEYDCLLGSVATVLTEELPLTTPGGEQIVVGRRGLIPCADNIRWRLLSTVRNCGHR